MGNKNKTKTQSQKQTPQTSKNEPQQSSQINNVSQTTEVLGQTREVLYGANVFPPNQIDLNIQGQGLYNMSNVNNNTTGQDIGRPIVQPVSGSHHSGMIHQGYGGQSGPYLSNANTNALHGAQTTVESNIPQWAANLCHQMNNIQVLLDGHAKRWQVVEQSIAAQNTKLTNMETKLSGISKIKEDLVMTNSKVHNVESELKTMRSTITEYSETINQYSDMYDDITLNNGFTDTKLKDIERRIEALEQKQSNAEQHIQDTNEKLTDVRWRSMRENLLFFGIPEENFTSENVENCEMKIKEFIKNNLGIDKEIPMDRAHRLGRFNTRNARPRPIVVKFTFFKDRELVRITSPQVLSGTNYGVSEQFPQEIEDKRKQLYSVAKDARTDKNNKVRLVRDKLYINGQLYDPESSTNTSQGQNNGRNRPPYIRNNAETPEREVRETTSTRRTWTRTFKRSQGHSVQTNGRTENANIHNKNRYSVLAESTPSNQQSHRSAYGGKKKATSPLEDSETFKKHHYDGNASADETQIDMVITENHIDMDLTQQHNEGQQSPSSVISGNRSADDLSSPPVRTMTLEPSPVVKMNNSTQPASSSYRCAQEREHSEQSARNTDSE